MYLARMYVCTVILVRTTSSFVTVLMDTRPGINHDLSYDREGRVITVLDGQGEGPNLYVVKLLHERGGREGRRTMPELHT